MSWILTAIHTYLLHPLHGNGYQFWSGPGAGSPIIAGVGVYLRKHNCHVHGCMRLQWHSHPEHGHPVCKKHYHKASTL